MQVKTIRHADVRGKELTYLELKTKSGMRVLINVGEKTFNAVKELLEDEQLDVVDEAMEMEEKGKGLKELEKTADKGNKEEPKKGEKK